MYQKNEKGLSLLTLLLAIAIVAGAAIWWKNSRDASLKEQAIAAKAQQEAQEEKNRQLERQKQEFQAQVEGERKKNEFDKAISELGAIYARWNDALKLADSTARIALSGPVGKLQEIKREAESHMVPECLVDSKKKMVDGMNKMIDGFMQFMGDADIGKILAHVSFGEGRKLFDEYEKGAAACNPVK